MAEAQTIQLPPLPSYLQCFDRQDDVLFDQDDSNTYGFRPGARTQARGTICTYIDQDDSGDFDPFLKKRYAKPSLENVTKKRARLSPTEDTLDDNVERKQKLSSWHTGRMSGKSFILCLSFSTSTGRGLLKRLNDEPSKQLRIGTTLPLNFTLLSTDSVVPNRLRNREKATRDTSFSSLESQQDFDQFALAENLIGHPCARGCKRCFELGLQCPLLQEKERYPCHICEEDGDDCELLFTPVRKRACESCTRRRIVCSYTFADDQNGPCDDCARDNKKCLAGPKSGRTRFGPSLDQSPAQLAQLIPKPPKSYSSCSQCRDGGRICSLIKSPEFRDCNWCRDLGQHCVFEIKTRVRRKSRAKKRGVTQQPTLSLSPQPVDIVELGDAQPSSSNGHGNKCKVIKTSFAHPIIFNYVPDSEESLPCDWCQDEAFGMMGLGELAVEVIDYQDHKGYVEVSGGHVGRGKEPSRMCIDCTASRMLIAGCAAHVLKPIGLISEQGTPASFDYCSICMEAASHACKDSALAKVMGCADDNYGGCGLRLCEECAKGFLNESGGNLSKLLSWKDELRIAGHGASKLRADAGFLKKDGELMGRITI